VDLIDLAVRRFKRGGDLRCLREPSELVDGHGQVGAWGLVDVMAINTDKFIVKVALELAWPSLRVELIVASSLGKHKGSFVCSALHTVGIPVDMGDTVLLGFPISWGDYRC